MVRVETISTRSFGISQLGWSVCSLSVLADLSARAFLAFSRVANGFDLQHGGSLSVRHHFTRQSEPKVAIDRFTIGRSCAYYTTQGYRDLSRALKSHIYPTC